MPATTAPASVIIRTARLASGLRLPYAESGDPRGTPIIMLHGVTDSWRSFERIIPRIARRGIRAIALTQRGHAGADEPTTYRTTDFSEDLAEFMDELSIDSAIIIGHSMGAMNALRFAADYPASTLGLILIGAFASGSRNAVIHEMLPLVRALGDPVDPEFAREFQLGTLANIIDDAFFDIAVRESLRVPARVWRACFEAFTLDEFTPSHGRITAPTRIIWGSAETICPREDQEALLGSIRGSTLSIYDGAGHATHWEQPERVAEEILSFAKAIDERGAVNP